METRANFILVGAFTLLGLLGLAGFALWFAHVEIQRQFAYLDLRFASVSGLNRAAEVRFAGLPVGQVVDVQLAPERDGTVLVRIEVAGDTPVRTDSVATIETLGVTGVSYVGISAGTPTARLLDITGGGTAQIATGRSTLQTLAEDAPEVVTELLTLVRDMNTLFSPDNRARVAEILINLEDASSNLGEALDDFAVVTSTVATASTDIAQFTIQLDPVVEGLGNTLAILDRTLTAVETLSDRAAISLDRTDQALVSGTQAFDAAGVFFARDLPPLMADLTQTSGVLRAEVARISAEAGLAMASMARGGDAVSDRFDQMQSTFDAADALIDRIYTSLDRIEAASGAFETLISGEATALVVDARAVLARANDAVGRVADMAETDLPDLLVRVRGGIDSATGVIDRMGAAVDGTAGRLDGLLVGADATLLQVRDTFAQANSTLEAINSALAAGEETLGIASQAFASADRVIAEEVAPIAGELRRSLVRLDEALAVVSNDLPQITGDLRAAAGSASDTFAEFGRVVQAAGGPLVAFSERALPDYAELGREARGLIQNLDRLARAIERDPARFIFSPVVPEYNR